MSFNTFVVGITLATWAYNPVRLAFIAFLMAVLGLSLRLLGGRADRHSQTSTKGGNPMDPVSVERQLAIEGRTGALCWWADRNSSSADGWAEAWAVMWAEAWEESETETESPPQWLTDGVVAQVTTPDSTYP